MPDSLQYLNYNFDNVSSEQEVLSEYLKRIYFEDTCNAEHKILTVFNV